MESWATPAAYSCLRYFYEELPGLAVILTGSLLYKDDFAKYADSLNALKLSAFFNGMIAGVGRQFSHKMANDIAGLTSGDYRQLNAAIERFQEARLFPELCH